MLQELLRLNFKKGGSSSAKLLGGMLLGATLLAGGAVGYANFGLAAEPAAATKAPAAATKAPAAGTKAAAIGAGLDMPKRLRLLTTQQYLNTVQDVFGPDITVNLRFAPLPRTNYVLMAGTSVGGVSDAQLEQYQKIAGILSARVLDDRHRHSLVPCKPADDSAADDACASKFLTRVVDGLYFVSPSKEHVGRLVGEAGAAANRLKSFYGGLQVVLENILLSPDVLMVVEKEEPDPKNPGRYRLDAESQAARLSLFLWNSAPDAKLRAAARRGDLFDPKKRARIVDSMLASPRLEVGVRSFFDDILGFETLETTNKEANIYPYFVGGLTGELREQTLRTIVNLLLTENGDYRELFTTRKTFMSPALGVLYGVSTTPGWQPYEFPPESGRAGILTHASFLAMFSHASRSSPTLRGKAIRELVLCQIIPPPPPDVDFSAVDNPDPKDVTARLRLTAHQKNPSCAGCHRIMDPMGLALENFDGGGRYRTDEMGHPIDVSGNLDGQAFTSVVELGQVLHDNARVPSCLARRALTYGTAGPLPRTAEPAINELSKDFVDGGYRLRGLLREIAMSSAFSEIAAPKPASPALKSADVLPAKKGG